MQSTGFGRKGLAPGAPSRVAARQPMGLASAATPNDPFAAKREAFLAQERSLRPAQSDPSETWEKVAATHGHIPSSHATSKPQRTLWMAYLLWFFLGQFSAHRFYLGATGSAITQVGMAICGLILAASGGPATLFSLFVLIPWMLWLFVDLFLIPGLQRKFCQSKVDAGEMRNVFA